MEKKTYPDGANVVFAAKTLMSACHGAAWNSGWWLDENGEEFNHDIETRDGLAWVMSKLLLVVTEIAEATEGARKNINDDKLPDRHMLEVELADAVIRCFDLAGGMGLDLPGAIADKMAFNAQRADHKLENRAKSGGKKI